MGKYIIYDKQNLVEKLPKIRLTLCRDRLKKNLSRTLWCAITIFRGALSKNRTCDSSLPRTCFTTRLLGQSRSHYTDIHTKINIKISIFAFRPNSVSTRHAMSVFLYQMFARLLSYLKHCISDALHESDIQQSI